MKKLVITAILISFVIFSFSQDFKYIGAAKCKMCHNSDEKGKQFGKWTESKHSKAFETLKGPEAAKVAKEKNIADASTSPQCLKCHSTAAMNAPELHAGITQEEGVSCESCHGPGSSYKSLNIMKDQALSLQNGLILPSEQVCVKCHNSESPNFKGFDYKTYAERIAHSNPNKSK
jgi:hypothetical protein